MAAIPVSRDLKRRRQKAARAALRGQPLKLDGSKAALAQEQRLVQQILSLMAQRDGSTQALAALRRNYPALVETCERAVRGESGPTPAETLVLNAAAD